MILDKWTESRGTYTYRTRIGKAIIEATVYERKVDIHNWEMRMMLSWHFGPTGEPRVTTNFTWPTLISNNELYHAHWKYCRDAEHAKSTALLEIDAFKRAITGRSDERAGV